MSKYEAMFILQPALNEEELDKVVSSISERIEQGEGRIENSQSLGKKHLAYAIKKQKEGYYQLINFEAKASLIKELKNYFRLTENILRVLILRRDV